MLQRGVVCLRKEAAPWAVLGDGYGDVDFKDTIRLHD